MAYLLDLYVLATSLVTIASVVCNYTDTPKDDRTARVQGQIDRAATQAAGVPW